MLFVVCLNTGSFLLRVEFIFLLFSALSPSVCGHSDYSYVADVPKLYRLK